MTTTSALVADPEAQQACVDATGGRPAPPVAYMLAGVYLGLLFVKSEVLSWYRIQEMFRFDSFHMYGVIAGALFVAAVSIQIITRWQIRTWSGDRIEVPEKQRTPLETRYWAGGTIFGLGWGLLGACPGPMFALFGAGITAIAVAIVSAMAGTWLYGALQSRLPH